NLVLNGSYIVNSGTLSIGQGGDILGAATAIGADGKPLVDVNGNAVPRITNTGTIDLTGGTLNVAVDIANTDDTTDGQSIDGLHGVLALGSDPNNPAVHGGITGGTVTIDGELDLQGSDFLKDGNLYNNTFVYVTGAGNSLDNETIINAGTIEVKSGDLT